MKMLSNIDLLTELAKRLDEFEIPLCLMLGKEEDGLELLLKKLGCVPVWCSTFNECKEQIQTGKVKVVFILENKPIGLNLVKWMKKSELDLPVALLGEDGDRESMELMELMEEYPVMHLGIKNLMEKVTSYVRGLHGAGMVLWTRKREVR